MPFQEIQALGKLLHELIFLHLKGEITDAFEFVCKLDCVT